MLVPTGQLMVLNDTTGRKNTIMHYCSGAC